MSYDRGNYYTYAEVEICLQCKRHQDIINKIEWYSKYCPSPLHILTVSNGLIIGSNSYFETAITWSWAGWVAISLSCTPSNSVPIPTVSMRTPLSRRTRAGALISSIDWVVAKTRSSWGKLFRPLFLNQLVFKPVKLDPVTHKDLDLSTELKSQYIGYCRLIEMLTYWGLTLRQSVSEDCGLCMCFIPEVEAMAVLMVGTT